MQRLLGSWISDPEDTSQQEKIQLDFAENGHMAYTIINKNKEQIILLTYRIEDSFLITDQPSHPREERTKFSITPEGKLMLTYGNQIQVFVRLQQK